MNIVDRILQAVQELKDKSTSAVDRVAEVKRIDDDGTAWVHIENGAPITPVKIENNCKVGDTIRVRLANGDAYILGNATHPATDDTTADKANSKATSALKGIKVIETKLEDGDFDGIDGTRIFTATADPTTPDYTFSISNLTGDGTPRVNDFIMSSYYRYTIQSVSATTVLAGERVSIRGARGASVVSITEEYALSQTTAEPADSAFSTTVQTPTETYPYLWNREIITFDDGTSTPMAKHILMTYTAGIEGRGISSIVNMYARSTTTTAPADSAFSTTVPTISAEYKYLWNYEIISYTDGTTPTTTAKAIIGVYGDKGDQGIQGEQGVSIIDVVEYYLATNLSSGVTTETSGWTTAVQSMTASNQYLWNYEKVMGTGNVVLNMTAPVIIGRYGQNGQNGSDGNDGVSVTSVVEHYLATAANAGVTRQTSGWSTTVQTVTKTNKYLWNYETINYSSGSPTETDPAIIGVFGDAGVGISRIQPQYALHTSSTTAPTSGWSDTPQTFVHGKYYWTREHIYFDDNTDGYSTAVYNKALTQANEEAYSANQLAEEVEQHFWNEDSGEDAGAHITEVTQEEWKDSTGQNYHSGGNLLMRSNVIKIRQALNTLAEFSSDGLTVNASSGKTIKLGVNGIELFLNAVKKASMFISAYTTYTIFKIISSMSSYYGSEIDLSSSETDESKNYIRGIVSYDDGQVDHNKQLFMLPTEAGFRCFYNNIYKYARLEEPTDGDFYFHANVPLRASTEAISLTSSNFTTSTGTFSSAGLNRFGNTLQMNLVVTVNSNVSAGGNLYEGTFKLTDYRPAVNVYGVGYYGSAAIVGLLRTDGTITLRVTGAAISKTTPASNAGVSFTYLI